jgi:hypothetical protein
VRILFQSDTDDPGPWRSALTRALPELMVEQVVDNIRRIERKEAPLGLVDAERGY